MHAHTPHTLGGDYVLPSARLEHSVVWLIRPGTLMDEYIQPANKFTQLQFGMGLMCFLAQRRMRSKCLCAKPSPSFLLCLKSFSFQVYSSLSLDGQLERGQVVEQVKEIMFHISNVDSIWSFLVIFECKPICRLAK